MIEPIQGEGGFVVPGRGLPARARGVGPANGIVFVADEIQSGFCRTGDWFACDHEGVVPDLVTTAKGIAGGLPLAGGDRSRRDHGRRRTSAASAARTAATRSPAPPRSASIEDDARATTSPPGPARSGELMRARRLDDRRGRTR